MYNNPFDEGLGGFAYFFLGFVSFTIVVSFFFKITRNQRPITRIGNRFASTEKFVLIILVLAFLYYIGENFLHAPIVNFFNNNLQNAGIPLAVDRKSVV